MIVKKEWSSPSDLTTRALIERLKDDAARLAAGHSPKYTEDAKAIGSELMELLTRIEGVDDERWSVWGCE